MAPAREKQSSLEEGLKDLNLTNEELNKFEKAFKDPEFLKLFEDYAKEVSDPKVKAETDQYLRQLEEQGRAEDVYGKGVQLITPTPGLVLKTKVVGPKGAFEADSKIAAAAAAGAGGKKAGLPTGQKVFINVCTSDKVDLYSLKEAKDASGGTGKQLSIPIITAAARQGTDKQGKPAAVYDVAVHPDTLEFAARSSPVMSTLAEMALEQVETVSRSRLSRQWRRLNTKFKTTDGCTEPPVMCVRTGEGGEAVGGRLRPKADAPAVNVSGAKSAAAAVAAAQAAEASKEGNGGGVAKAAEAVRRSAFSFDKKGRSGQQQQREQEVVKDSSQAGYRHPDGALTPEWTLVHRGQADLAAAWGDAGRGLALDIGVPKELVVRVMLPEATSAAGLDLDVGERRLTLKVSGKYLLDAVLPYQVDGDKGKAKFDKARKQLEITLPVVPPLPPPRPPAAAAVQKLPPAAAAGESVATVAPSGRPAELEEAVNLAGTAAERTLEDASSTRESAEASRSSGEEQRHRDDAGGVAATALEEGKEMVGREQPLTENECKWRELHYKQHQQDNHCAPEGAGEDDSGGTSPSRMAEAAGPPDTGAPPGAGCAAASGAGVTVEVSATTAALEPTVLLTPRLRRGLAMELD